MARIQAVEKEAAEKGGQDLPSVLERIPVPLDELPPSALLEVLIDVLYADSDLPRKHMEALCLGWQMPRRAPLTAKGYVS